MLKTFTYTSICTDLFLPAIIVFLRVSAILLATRQCYTKTIRQSYVISGWSQNHGRELTREDMQTSLRCPEAVCHSSTDGFHRLWRRAWVGLATCAAEGCARRWTSGRAWTRQPCRREGEGGGGEWLATIVLSKDNKTTSCNNIADIQCKINCPFTAGQEFVTRGAKQVTMLKKRWQGSQWVSTGCVQYTVRWTSMAKLAIEDHVRLISVVSACFQGCLTRQWHGRLSPEKGRMSATQTTVNSSRTLNIINFGYYSASESMKMSFCYQDTREIVFIVSTLRLS